MLSKLNKQLNDFSRTKMGIIDPPAFNKALTKLVTKGFVEKIKGHTELYMPKKRDDEVSIQLLTDYDNMSDKLTTMKQKIHSLFYPTLNDGV